MKSINDNRSARTCVYIMDTKKKFRELLPYLQALKGVKSARKRKQLIEAGGSHLINCLSECCLNLLHGNIKLSKVQVNKLRRHAGKIRELSRKKTCQTKKKRIVQQGGFISALLPVILSAVTGLLASAGK